MEKFQNKYRIDTARAVWWNYNAAAAYFVTICTKDSVAWFGHIENGIMCLNEMGSLLYQEWMNTPSIRPDMNITLGAFVVMPDHFHGIVIIGNNEYNHDSRDALQCVSTLQCATNQFGPQRKNLASIIRGVKSTVTKQARIINPAFGWLPRFHDHIIRNEKSFNSISNYIIDNPTNWTKKTHCNASIMVVKKEAHKNAPLLNNNT